MSDPARRVLVAEDDQFLRRAACATLKRHGYTVFTATNGEEALRLAREEVPDLILLDLIMPKIQGFEVLRQLRIDPVTRTIPVIVLSNLSQPADVAASLAAGARAYLVKTDLTLEELAAKVDAALAGDKTDGAARGRG